MSAGITPASSSRGLFFKKVGVLLIVGCGARGLVVEEELLDGAGGGGGTARGTGGTGGTGGSGSGSGANSGSGASSSSEDPFHFEDSQLEDCEPGFVWSASSDRECNFRFNSRCYDGEKEVCACACPRATNSTCILSGFLSDPNNPLTVTCQPRRSR